MGNRAALILSDGATPGQGLSELAYGTNNVTAPFWYAVLAESDLEGWEARWQKLTAEEPSQAEYDAVTLWVAWPVAEARLAAVAARAEAEAPAWGPHFIAWQQALRRLAADRKARWLGIDLVEIFAFHEEPAAMVAEARDGLLSFHGPAPMRLAMTGNLEHLGGTAEAVDLPARPAAPKLRYWRELKHLPASLLIVAGIWILTQSVLATVAMALVVLSGLGLLVAKGPRGA